jgi:cytochrome b involved in lipid metabolism
MSEQLPTSSDSNRSSSDNDLSVIQTSQPALSAISSSSQMSTSQSSSGVQESVSLTPRSSLNNPLSGGPKIIFISPNLPANSESSSPPREKVRLKPGNNIWNWIKLNNSLSPQSPRPVTLSELATHSPSGANRESGLWVAVRGRVYDMGPFFEFHPGGVEILEAVCGTDASAQFDRYHAFINVESMLRGCLIGPLVPDAGVADRAGLSHSSASGGHIIRYGARHSQSEQ